MTTLHEAAQQALEMNLEELKQIATLWKNFRIGNMGDYPKQAVELLKLQSQYHAAAAPDVVLELIRQIEALRSALAQQGEPVAWVLFRKDDDGLEPVMFYGGKEKPEGEFKDRFELHGVWTAPAAQPDWSLLEATQESLREHMAMVKELRAKLAQQGEPVGYTNHEGTAFAVKWSGKLPPNTTLYAAAAPAPHPDTRTVVQQMVDSLKYYADEPDDLGYDALAAGQKLLKELK